MGTTMTVTTRITHKYLMGKTKWDLCQMIFMLMDQVEKAEEDAQRMALEQRDQARAELAQARAEVDLLRTAIGQHNQEKDRYNEEYDNLKALSEMYLKESQELRRILDDLTTENAQLKNDAEKANDSWRTAYANLSAELTLLRIDTLAKIDRGD